MYMLANRNLDWDGSAQVLARLTPVYLSASTIGRTGHGLEHLTPALVEAFATVLGVDPGDLAGFCGVGPVDPDRSLDPAAAAIAELIWDLRRLTAGQVRDVRKHARLLASP
ncbi:hypothetical protein [Frankia nepalensis]|nr:hypothetical protein [Frankia nepalensis]